MLDKCSNPYCSARFCRLKDGRLFRLEADPSLHTRRSNRVEFFWLCHTCSLTMTLRIEEDESVGVALLPEPRRRVSDENISVSDRRWGLLVSSIDVQLPEQGSRKRIPSNAGDDAAWLSAT